MLLISEEERGKPVTKLDLDTIGKFLNWEGQPELVESMDTKNKARVDFEAKNENLKTLEKGHTKVTDLTSLVSEL